MKKRKCIKCGESDIALTYRGPYLADKWYGDSLYCVCRTCGYVWTEACLDKQVKRKKAA